MPGVSDTGEGGGTLIVPVLGGAVAGAALQLQQPQLWALPVYIGLFALGLALLVAARRARRLAWPLALAGALLAGGAGCGWRAQAFAAQALDPALQGRDLVVTGVVDAMPQRSDTGLRFRLAVESARLDGAPVRLPPLIQLGWWGGAGGGSGGELTRQSADLRAGERWRMTVRLKAPHGNLNPHGFDYELWLWEQGIQATGYVRAGPRDAAPLRVDATWRHPVELARQNVRDAILARVDDRRLAGVVAALVTGDQNAIDRADWDVFRATGVAHLMSISGLHITMFAWLAAAAVGWLWRRSARLCLAWPAQHAALVGGLLLATGYALFSGLGVPAQRTVTMLATLTLLRLLGLRWPWPLAWLLACAVVVAVDPWALLQPGFWLSFVAVGVLFAVDGGRQHPAGAAGRVRAMLREQAVVTLALTPLALLLFGQASVVGLPANLLAIPWVTLVVTPLAMGGVLAPPLWDAAAWAVQALGLLLQWMAALPYASVSVAAPPLWAGAAGVLGGAVLAMRWPWSLRLLGVPLLLPVLWWQPPRPAAGDFELLAADVGQGNAVIVRTASHTLVYDAGPRWGPESDAGHRVLVPLLRALDERVDTLVLSHRDSDHTGGAAALLAQQPGAALLASLEDGHELLGLRPTATRCAAGQGWEWDGVRFDVLHPAQPWRGGAVKPNAVSCVLRVAARGGAGPVALLVGDIEQPQESALVAGDAAALRAHVLLAPHHGSKTSSSGPFLDAVAPSLALVQAGYRNRFGHPAPEVMARYAERGVRVVASPQCGAATWQSAAPQAVRCERDTARRYWHHRFP